MRIWVIATLQWIILFKGKSAPSQWQSCSVQYKSWLLDKDKKIWKFCAYLDVSVCACLYNVAKQMSHTCYWGTIFCFVTEETQTVNLREEVMISYHILNTVQHVTS